MHKWRSKHAAALNEVNHLKAKMEAQKKQWDEDRQRTQKAQEELKLLRSRQPRKHGYAFKVELERIYIHIYIHTLHMRAALVLYTLCM